MRADDAVRASDPGSRVPTLAQVGARRKGKYGQIRANTGTGARAARERWSGSKSRANYRPVNTQIGPLIAPPPGNLLAAVASVLVNTLVGYLWALACQAVFAGLGALGGLLGRNAYRRARRAGRPAEAGRMATAP